MYSQKNGRASEENVVEEKENEDEETRYISRK